MFDTPIYDELDVPRVINAASTKTRIGGSRIRPEALEAMRRAGESFVRISDLQARASKLISDVTGSEAGYVGCGAAACMTLGAAATIAGDDLGAMSRLPNTEGVPNEIVMPRTHRNGYDHALRTAGATIVDIGTNDNRLGTGSTEVEPWELDDAITEDTAAVAYMQKAYTMPSLKTVVEIAHDCDVPVIVDAAAEVPPRENLSRFVEAGADMVIFSGGKAIRGPQTTGILAGKKEYVRSAALQHLDMHVAPEVWEPPAELFTREEIDGVPRQGIGRPLKVGKEELVGLITALKLFIEEDHAEKQVEWAKRTERIENGLSHLDGLTTAVSEGGKLMVAPEVTVTLDAEVAGIDTISLVRSLRQENPRIFVGCDNLAESSFAINSLCLTDEEANYVVERIRDYVD